MTNKEALAQALEPFETEEIRDADTGEVLTPARKMLPLTLPWFIKHMAALLVYCAEMSLATDFPDMTIDGQKTSGKSVERPSFVDYFRVLHGDDLMRAIPLNLQLQGFLEWWLEQEAKTDNLGDNWCDFETIAENWNEYANIRREERKEDSFWK